MPFALLRDQKLTSRKPKGPETDATGKCTLQSTAVMPLVSTIIKTMQRKKHCMLLGIVYVCIGAPQRG